MIEITSKSNEHFRRWLDLASSKGIKKNSEFILMGDKLVEEFLENPTFKVKAEIITEEHQPRAFKSPHLKGQKIALYKLPKVLFKEIDIIGTHSNLLVLEAEPLKSLQIQKTEGLEIVTPLGDPANLGALARSALAFGASKLILTEEAANPYHPKAIKASAGALLKIPIYRTSKFADFLQEQDNIFALDSKGENIERFKWPKDIRLALGEEGPGFSGLKGLNKLSIPTQGVESLNATVAASIALYSYSLKHPVTK